MAATVKKTTEQDEQDVVENRFPQSFKELRDYMGGLFSDLPDLTPPARLKPADSASFAMIDARINDNMASLQRQGYFKSAKELENENKEREKNGLEPLVPDADQILMDMAVVVEYCDAFFRRICTDDAAYDTWADGRTLGTLFTMFVVLERFYGEQLGKSNASKTA